MQQQTERPSEKIHVLMQDGKAVRIVDDPAEIQAFKYNPPTGCTLERHWYESRSVAEMILGLVGVAVRKIKEKRAKRKASKRKK